MVRPVDSCVDTHAPLRGPLVRPVLLAGLRVSRIVTVTRYFPSRVLMTVVSFLHVGATHGCEFCDRFDGAFRESLPVSLPLCRAASAECGIPTSAECMLFCLCLHPLLSRCFALHLAFRLACGLRLWLTIHQHVLDTLPLSVSFLPKFVIT